MNTEDIEKFLSKKVDANSKYVKISFRKRNDRETGRSKGFGFVEMSDDSAALKAIKELDGGSVEGRTIRVVEARPKEKSGFSGNGSRGGFKSKSPFRY